LVVGSVVVIALRSQVVLAVLVVALTTMVLVVRAHRVKDIMVAVQFMEHHTMVQVAVALEP
jgi:hypothetical protein